MPFTPRSAWVISDGAAGNERQALALAAALDVPARVLVLPLRPPWSWCAPRQLPGGRLALSARDREAFTPPWPDLAIGCGRDAALLTRMLRSLSDGACFTVQILDPRLDTRHWDAVIAPRHDDLAGANVIRTLGALNPVDDAWLAQALAGTVAALAQGGSVLATASRRTPAPFAQSLRDALAKFPGVFWSGGGANPYPGILGWADRIVVTPDSVNMISEACATGLPVHTVTTAPLPDIRARFHDALRERGLLTDPGAPPGHAPPLRETGEVAAQLRSMFAARHAA